MPIVLDTVVGFWYGRCMDEPIRKRTDSEQAAFYTKDEFNALVEDRNGGWESYRLEADAHQQTRARVAELEEKLLRAQRTAVGTEQAAAGLAASVETAL